jgi:hypothetical protein
MHLPMLVLGGGLVVVAAILKLSGGVDDFHAHAAPFWLFIAGIAGLFTGGWYRDTGRHQEAMALAHVRRDAHAALAMAPALAPQLAPAVVGGLSALQRPVMNLVADRVVAPVAAVAPAVAPVLAALVPATTAAPDIMARITAVEAENAVLRQFLLDAGVSISRSERRQTADRRH